MVPMVGTAFSRSASSQTTVASLPPSSSVTRGAGEADLVDPRVLSQHLAEVVRARNDLEDAGREDIDPEFANLEVAVGRKR
jgi:hypothetical protein